MFWWLLAITILMVAAFFLWPIASIPSEEAGKASLDDFNFPTNSNGRVIPEVFGTCHLYGNILGAWDLRAVAIEQEVDTSVLASTTVTVGYAYFLGLAYAICGKVDSILEFRMDNVTCISMTMTGDGSFSAKTGKNAEQNGSSYSESTIRAYLGSQSSPDAYLVEKTGYDIAYGGITYLVFEDAFVGDNVRSCPMYSCVVKRTNLLAGWSNYDINGDANPAHVIYFIMTEMLGISTAMMNTSAFQAVGDVLYTEGLGMSFVMSSEQEAQNWIKEIQRHIDGVVYLNPSDGLFTIKLIRDDYTIGDCPIINESNSKKVELSRKGWEDTVSRITIKYTERSTFKENTITKVNTAARINLGYIRADSLNFMGLSNNAAAMQVMNRLLKKQSYPLATLKYTISSQDFVPLPGDVHNFSNANLTPAISNMAVRVMNVTGFRDNEQEITVEGLEDIFGIGDMAVGSNQSNLAVGWDYSIDAFAHYAIKDARQEQSKTSAIMPLFVVPSGLVTGVRVYVDGVYKNNVGGYGYALVDATYAITNEMDESATGLLVTGAEGLEEISLSRAQYQKAQRAVIVDNEIMFYQNCLRVSSNTYRITKIMRGQVGTTIAQHDPLAPAYFSNCPITGVKVALIKNATVSGELVAYNGYDFSTQNFAHTYGWTVETPYPPGNVKGSVTSGVVHLDWVPANRWEGANYRSIDTIAADDLSPEATFEINNYYSTTYTSTSGGVDFTGTAGNYRVRACKDERYSAWVGVVVA